MELKKAVKKQVKLRLGMSGASGFGKTYSSLLLAYGFTSDWSKIAVIDTENDSASLYSDLGEYNVLNLQSPYSPERYIEAIKTCEDAGIELIIIDSITHEWDGKGGCLDIHSDLGGQFAHWSKVTPRHNSFIQAILQSKCHIITTVRRKQDYDMVKNDKGKIEPVKVGLKEVTRDGFEYELTVNFEFLNDKHLVKASKDRTSLFANEPEFVITKDTGIKIKEWCNSGIDEVELAVKEVELLETKSEIAKHWNNNIPLQKNAKYLEAIKNAGEKLKKEEPNGVIAKHRKVVTDYLNDNQDICVNVLAQYKKSTVETLTDTQINQIFESINKNKR